MTPRFSSALFMQASPFLLSPSQTDGMMLHVIVVMVFIPIPSAMHDPGFWNSPYCVSPLLLCQPVLGLLSCWDTPEQTPSKASFPLQEAGALNKGESKPVLEVLPLWESGEEQNKKPTNSFSVLT